MAHRVHDGRSRGRQARLADALDAVWALRMGLLHQGDLHLHVGVHEGGDLVVHHVAVAELAVLVDHLLHQRVAQSHDDGALDLLEAAGGVDGLAHIVGGPHLLHVDPARLGVHRHDSGLGAVHPHDRGPLGLPAVHRRGIEDVRGAIPAYRHHRRLLVEDTGSPHIVDVDALFRSGPTLDIAVGGVGYILRCHAELDGRQAAQLFFDVLAGLQHRIAGVEGGARGRGGLIIGSNGGIHRCHGDLLQSHTQGFRRNLGQCGGDALAHLCAGGHDVQGAVLVHLHQNRGGGGGTGELVEAGDALAAEVSLLVRPAVRQILPADVGCGGLQTLLHRHGLHDLAGDAYISVLQHVFQAQLQGIYPQLLGDPVHLPLVGSGHLRDAKATIGGSQGLIGHVYIGIHLGVRDLVGAVGGKACVVVHPGIGGDIGAGIPLNLHLLGSECTVPLHAGLHVDVDRGAAHSCGKFFVPAVGQLHRTALGLQGEGHSNGLALGLILAAEATADLRDRKAHLLHGHMKGLGDQPPVAEGGLSGHPDVDLPRDGIRLRGGSMGFNGGVLQHPAGEVALHDLVRLGEASLHISLFQVVLVPDVGALHREAGTGAVVLAPVLMDQHLIFHRGLQVIDHW